MTRFCGYIVAVCLGIGGFAASAPAAASLSRDPTGARSNRVLERAELRSLLLRRALDRRIQADAARHILRVPPASVQANRRDGGCPETLGAS